MTTHNEILDIKHLIKIIPQGILDTPLGVTKEISDGKPFTVKDLIISALLQTQATTKREVVERVKEIVEELPVYMKVAGGDLLEPKEAILKDDILSALTEDTKRE